MLEFGSATEKLEVLPLSEKVSAVQLDIERETTSTWLLLQCIVTVAPFYYQLLLISYLLNL